MRTRGSQFKVEAVLFKLSKPESFMMLSPTREDVRCAFVAHEARSLTPTHTQVGRQNAAECQPLIMEPQSAFYKGPLVVLDFTSLYPSVVIAHNYCWSCVTTLKCAVCASVRSDLPPATALASVASTRSRGAPSSVPAPSSTRPVSSICSRITSPVSAPRLDQARRYSS